MKNKDFGALAQRLLPDVPGFEVKAPLMFIPPLKHTLRGLCFESHSHDVKLFYVWVFLLPLCVPTKYLGFNLGKRIENPGVGPWNADAPNLLPQLSAALKREAVPFISHVESPRDLAQAAKSLCRTKDPYTQEAIAYALACAGDAGKAVAELDTLLAMLDTKVPWQLEMVERAQALKAKLLANPAEARGQLEAWENESVKNLGLEKFRRI
jgi:hypothetical protein